MNRELSEKLDIARLRIFTKDPFLGYVLQQIDIFIDENIETAATNGKIIMFGKNFLKKLSIKETIFVLMHELMHILLEHPQRAKHLKNRVKYNVAADIVVNDILQFFEFSHGKLPLIFGKKYNIDGFAFSVEEIYYHYLKDNPEGNILDLHNLWDEVSADAFDKLKDIISKALNMGYSSKIFDRSRFVNTPQYGYSSAKWKELLERYVIKDILDYSFNKIDNRYQGVLLPAFSEDEETLKNIWFVVDVSGSMSVQEIELLYGEIERIINHYKMIKCDISFFSTETTVPIKFKNKVDLKNAFTNTRSTGGTDFNKIFIDMIKFFSRKLPSLVVVLTDGGAPYPNKKSLMNVPVIWCLTDDNNLPQVGEYIIIKSERD